MAVPKQAKIGSMVCLAIAGKKQPKEIALHGERGRHEASLQEKLGELGKCPSKKKFELFLMQKEKAAVKKAGVQLAEEVRELLLALDTYIEWRDPLDKTVGEIVDRIFSVYDYGAVVRIARSIAGMEKGMEEASASLLMAICVCSKNGDAARHAFVELRDLYIVYGNTLNIPFEEAVRIVEEDARSEGVSRMAREELFGRGYFAGMRAMRVN